MKEMLRYGIILGVICMVASGLLATVNLLTQQRIIAQIQAIEKSGLKEVFPDAVDFQLVKSAVDTVYYKAYDKSGVLLGVAFKTPAKGYSSNIETMVGMTAQGKIIAIKILSQNETPGLGSRIADSSFTGRFASRDIGNLSEVQAITGATISSKAVIDSVKKEAEKIQRLLKDGR